MAKKKKTFNKMDLFLFIDLTLIIAFTITIIVLSVKGFYIQETLITCVFSVLGGELGVMGWIKNIKEKAEARKQELQDRKYYENLQKKENNKEV